MSNPWLDAAQSCSLPVPPPGHTWSREEIRTLHLEHLRELERSWIEERKQLVSDGHQPWQLDEALRALRARLQELAAEGPAEDAPPETPCAGTEPPVTGEPRTASNVAGESAHEADSGQDARLRRLL